MYDCVQVRSTPQRIPTSARQLSSCLMFPHLSCVWNLLVEETPPMLSTSALLERKFTAQVRIKTFYNFHAPLIHLIKSIFILKACTFPKVGHFATSCGKSARSCKATYCPCFCPVPVLLVIAVRYVALNILWHTVIQCISPLICFNLNA